jgi:predicted N-acetyltransferase YhbS
MKIIKFENIYRDDLIFMILEAKNALGRVPGINEDLLDIQANYYDKGDMFWIALDDNNRVIGSVGYNSIENSNDVILHRLFVKYNLKYQGIGTALLNTAEEHLKSIGKASIIVHLGNREQFYESWQFYPKHGYNEFKQNYMRKKII